METEHKVIIWVCFCIALVLVALIAGIVAVNIANPYQLPPEINMNNLRCYPR